MLNIVRLIAFGFLPLLMTVEETPAVKAPADVQRTLYAVNQAPGVRGSISVYDIDHQHRLIETIETVSGVEDVKGVAASAATGKLYVAYRSRSGIGRVFCLDIARGKIIWDRRMEPDVDRLAISPDGRLLYVPTWEGTSADFINVADAKSGEVIQKVYFSNHSHDAQYPLSGPVYQETKAEDGSGNYLYAVDPHSYSVSRTGPFLDILGPFAIDSASRYVVANVTNLWGMQVADLKTGNISTAKVPVHPEGDPGLLHGIGWTPDETEVWEAGAEGEVYVWDMRNPMSPSFEQTIHMQIPHRAHWLTFTINGDFGYVAPVKNTAEKTEVFSVSTHLPAGFIDSSEDMLEVDFEHGQITKVGDQFGIGRRSKPF
jgi:DNA-binding beta-propeller fold protein YncE